MVSPNLPQMQWLCKSYPDCNRNLMLGHWRVLTLPFNFSLLKRWYQVSGNHFLPSPRTESQLHHRGLKEAEQGRRSRQGNCTKSVPLCASLSELDPPKASNDHCGWRGVPLHLAPVLRARLSAGATEVLLIPYSQIPSSGATRVTGPVSDVQLCQ